jgi:hypothetical protein
MVDLAEIQAATGVLVAAIYYVLTMRATQRNMNLTLETRRIGLIDNLSTRIVNMEGMRSYFELARALKDLDPSLKETAKRLIESQW